MTLGIAIGLCSLAALALAVWIAVTTKPVEAGAMGCLLCEAHGRPRIWQTTGDGGRWVHSLNGEYFVCGTRERLAECLAPDFAGNVVQLRRRA